MSRWKNALLRNGNIVCIVSLGDKVPMTNGMTAEIAEIDLSDKPRIVVRLEGRHWNHHLDGTCVGCPHRPHINVAAIKPKLDLEKPLRTKGSLWPTRILASDMETPQGCAPFAVATRHPSGPGGYYWKMDTWSLDAVVELLENVPITVTKYVNLYRDKTKLTPFSSYYYDTPEAALKADETGLTIAKAVPVTWKE